MAMTKEELNEEAKFYRECVKDMKEVRNKMFLMTANEIDNAIKELWDKGIYIPRHPDYDKFDLYDYYYNRDYLTEEIDKKIEAYESMAKHVEESKPENWISGDKLDFLLDYDDIL